MSLFASESSWGGNCSAPNQSPIDLSQSIAEKCDLLCDLDIDDAQVSSASVAISDEGLVLSGNLGSCKFKGQGQTCAALLVNHPSHHTINNIAGDGEVIAFFTTPTGENLAVSALFRVNPANSHASQFLHQFVAYANASGPTQISLNDWTLKHMIPSDASQQVQDGTQIIPGCDPTTWVVFQNMLQIDANDFAFLVRNVQAGSRSIQSLGSRNVQFNDAKKMSISPSEGDGKVRIRFRPRHPSPPSNAKPYKVHQPSLTTSTEQALSSAASGLQAPTGIWNRIKAWATKQFGQNGWIDGINAILMVVISVLAAQLGWTAATNPSDAPRSLALYRMGQRWSFFKKAPVIPTPTFE